MAKLCAFSKHPTLNYNYTNFKAQSSEITLLKRVNLSQKLGDFVKHHYPLFEKF
jgi:hypothetical protein